MAQRLGIHGELHRRGLLDHAAAAAREQSERGVVAEVDRMAEKLLFDVGLQVVPNHFCPVQRVRATVDQNVTQDGLGRARHELPDH
jgi:hypothetical protein